MLDNMKPRRKRAREALEDLATFKKKIRKFDQLSAKGFSIRTAVRATGMPSVAYGFRMAHSTRS